MYLAVIASTASASVSASAPISPPALASALALSAILKMGTFSAGKFRRSRKPNPN